jgi:Tfp pilus assembly protein PilN
MIKVNLLRDQTVRVRKTFAKSNVSRTGLIFLAIFLVSAGAMGTWAFYVNRQIAAGIVKFEKLKQLRQSRIDVIEKLKEGQSGPVLLLNTLIQSIPRDGDLWLTSLTQKSGIIKIVGQTRIPEVIPDLMRNLTASGIFASVDLELIERQEDSSKFSLICTSIKKPQAE